VRNLNVLASATTEFTCRHATHLCLRNIEPACDIWNRFAPHFYPSEAFSKKWLETCFGGVIPTGKILERQP
jgi:hypothetical protein